MHKSASAAFVLIFVLVAIASIFNLLQPSAEDQLEKLDMAMKEAAWNMKDMQSASKSSMEVINNTIAAKIVHRLQSPTSSDANSMKMAVRLRRETYSSETCQAEPVTLMQETDFPSPLYPAAYPNDALCVWILNTGEYCNLVHLSFHFVALEMDNDYLCLYNGDSESSEEIACLQGYIDQNPVFQTTQQHMWIKFETNQYIKDGGFSAQYTVVASTGCEVEVREGCTINETIEICELAVTDIIDSNSDEQKLIIEGCKADTTYYNCIGPNIPTECTTVKEAHYTSMWEKLNEAQITKNLCNLAFQEYECQDSSTNLVLDLCISAMVISTRNPTTGDNFEHFCKIWRQYEGCRAVADDQCADEALGGEEFLKDWAQTTYYEMFAIADCSSESCSKTEDDILYAIEVCEDSFRSAVNDTNKMQFEHSGQILYEQCSNIVQFIDCIINLTDTCKEFGNLVHKKHTKIMRKATGGHQWEAICTFHERRTEDPQLHCNKPAPWADYCFGTYRSEMDDFNQITEVLPRDETYIIPRNGTSFTVTTSADQRLWDSCQIFNQYLICAKSFFAVCDVTKSVADTLYDELRQHHDTETPANEQEDVNECIARGWLVSDYEEPVTVTIASSGVAPTADIFNPDYDSGGETYTYSYRKRAIPENSLAFYGPYNINDDTKERRTQLSLLKSRGRARPVIS